MAGYSQTLKLDSLHDELQQHLEDTSRLDILLELATEYNQARMSDSALHYASAAMSLTREGMHYHRIKALRLLGTAYVRKNDYTTANKFLQQIRNQDLEGNVSAQQELANALNYKGVVISYLGNYDSAIVYFTSAKSLYEKLSQEADVASCLINTGKMYMHLSSYPIAVRYFYEALQYIDSENTSSRAILNLNLGQCYVLLKEYEKAKSFTADALYAFEQEGTSIVGISESYSTLGHIYTNLNKTDSSLYYLQRGLALSREGEYKDGIAEGHYYLGLHYLRNGEWQLAAEQAREAFLQFDQEKAKRRKINTMLVMAEAYLHLNSIAASYQFATDGLHLSRELGARAIEADFLKLLSEIQAIRKNYASAYNYRSQYSAVKDTVLSEEKTRQLANMEALYETEKKEQALALAISERKATEASLAEQKSKEIMLISGLILAVGILSLGAFLYILLRRNKKIVEVQNRRLTTLNQTKDRFFAIVGHDLRGPITSFSGISSLVNWYLDKKENDKLRKLGENISKSAEQLDILLNNLLNWAMTQTDGVPYHPEPMQLKGITSEVSNLFENLLAAKRIHLTDNTRESTYVLADKNALQLVLRNLLSNALKFTPIDGTIVIDTHEADGKVCIEIKDNGVGMAPEKLSKLFELYHDKSTSGTKSEKGTGLGLTLCKEYVQLNRGSIWVSSTVDKGTTFSFTVPTCQPSGEEVAANEAEGLSNINIK